MCPGVATNQCSSIRIDKAPSRRASECMLVFMLFSLSASHPIHCAIFQALYSLETQLRHSDESFSLYKSWFSRITQILHDEEHKRGRPGLRGPRADNGQAAPILGGDAVIGALQNTLSENDTQARALGIKLERVGYSLHCATSRTGITPRKCVFDVTSVGQRLVAMAT